MKESDIEKRSIAGIVFVDHSFSSFNEDFLGGRLLFVFYSFWRFLFNAAEDFFGSFIRDCLLICSSFIEMSVQSNQFAYWKFIDLYQDFTNFIERLADFSIFIENYGNFIKILKGLSIFTRSVRQHFPKN